MLRATAYRQRTYTAMLSGACVGVRSRAPPRAIEGFSTNLHESQAMGVVRATAKTSSMNILRGSAISADQSSLTPSKTRII
jgi:hypothetical protein